MIFVATPNLFRGLGLVHTPQVNVLTDASDCNTCVVLPLDLKSLEGRIKLAVIELGDVLALRDVPDIDFARFESRSCNQIRSSFVELGIHEHHIKIFDVLNFNLRSVGRVVKFPDSGHHVRGARDQPVTLTVPVDRRDIGRDLRQLAAALDVRQ